MHKQPLLGLLALWLLFSAYSCAKLPIDSAFRNIEVRNPSDTSMFAIIGDYGEDSPKEGEVAAMVKGWNPEFIVTVGDNNYPLGSAGTIAKNVGKHYGDFIYNPDAPADRICTGKAATDKVNRFFPAPGNHDNYAVPNLKPYLDYFTLPGDERNYDFTWGPVHFFSLNTGAGGTIASETKDWLKDKASKSDRPFKLVYLHHPPFSPGPHGSASGTQLPYKDWGVDAVLAGHEHFYVRVTDKTSPNKPAYLIIGNSGNENLYGCNANPLDPTRFTIDVCDNNHFGALKVYATTTKMVFQYFTLDDLLHPKDIYEIAK